MGIRAKNVHTSMTINRFLYAALEQEAVARSIKIGHVVNEELTKLLKEKIRLLKIQEASKYD